TGAGSTGFRFFLGNLPGLLRPWFGSGSGTPRSPSKCNGLHAEQPRSAVEAESKPTRSAVEAESKPTRSGVERVPKQSRSAPEHHPKTTRRPLEDHSKRRIPTSNLAARAQRALQLRRVSDAHPEDQALAREITHVAASVPLPAIQTS